MPGLIVVEGSPNAGGCAVLPVKREVIEGQLLAALDDKSKVACLFSEEDLILLIRALRSGLDFHDDRPGDEKRREMLRDLQQLCRSAFG